MSWFSVALVTASSILVLQNKLVIEATILHMGKSPIHLLAVFSLPTLMVFYNPLLSNFMYQGIAWSLFFSLQLCWCQAQSVFLVFVLLGSVALCCGLGLITMYETSKWKDDSRLEICLGLCPYCFSLFNNFLILYLCPVTYDISKESMKNFLCSVYRILEI